MMMLALPFDLNSVLRLHVLCTHGKREGGKRGGRRGGIKKKEEEGILHSHESSYSGVDPATTNIQRAWKVHCQSVTSAQELKQTPKSIFSPFKTHFGSRFVDFSEVFYLSPSFVLMHSV